MLYPKYIGVTYHLYFTIMATCRSLQWLLTSLHNVTIVEMFDCIMLSLRNFDIFLGISDGDNFCTPFYFTLLVDLCRSQLICIGSFAYNLSLLILQAQVIIADCFSFFSHSAVKYGVTGRYWIPLIFQSDCIRWLRPLQLVAMNTLLLLLQTVHLPSSKAPPTSNHHLLMSLIRGYLEVTLWYLALYALYYYMRNFCNLISLEQWYFRLILQSNQVKRSRR